MLRETARHAKPRTYFVGRREDETAEIYAISGTDVERLSAPEPELIAALDWRGGGVAALELSRLLLSRVVSQPPSLELEARFALDALAHFPEDGFVLDAEALRLWIRRALGFDPRVTRRSLADRLRWLFPLGAPRRKLA